MKNITWRTLPHYGALIALAVAPLLASCEPTSLTWDEEVKLHDDRIIILRRHNEIAASGFPVNKRGINKSHEFCYKPMGLYWKSKGEYTPEILGIVEGKAYVKVPIGGSIECMLQDFPATNALYFVWENSKWKRIPYEQFPKEVRRTNLLLWVFGTTAEDDMGPYVTIEQKERRDTIYHTMKYNTWGWTVESVTDQPWYRGECSGLKEEMKNMTEEDKKKMTTDTPEVFLSPTPKHCELN